MNFGNFSCRGSGHVARCGCATWQVSWDVCACDVALGMWHVAWWGPLLAENEISHFPSFVRLVRKKKLKRKGIEREKSSHVRESEEEPRERMR